MARKNGSINNINKDQFEKLCALQCTEQEIASFFDVCTDTLETFCKNEYNCRFSEVFKKKKDVGKISLRRTQFKQAEKSTSMAIWLGKQYLGQADHVNVGTSLTTDEKDPLSMAFDMFMGKGENKEDKEE